ncbi:MAG: hypothetical protein GWP91_07850, partial [Rhodobacterales bacterium]|nr:hypothetical protein [Rhodobacterales bacterium]
MARTLETMLEGGKSIQEIGVMLDALDGDARWEELNTLNRSQQRSLYDLAEKADPLTLDDFVPCGNEPLKPVVHRGRNTLPVPGLNFFAKVMTRQPNGAVVGYNQSPIGFLVGPGYYTTIMTKDEWSDRGAVVVDYYQPPSEGPIPEGWPWLRPNWVGIQLVVYFQTRDFMRKVSQHVTI